MKKSYVGAVFGDGSAKGLNDASIDVEEIIAGHARLAGDAGGDDDDVRILQGLTELVLARETSDLGEIKVGSDR